ncbi:hypothetical protein ZWY2020_016108 [Hordeum vulgare]|nr:hypothetical protein ZWY2020_016108 [Hordeum vulgare]
MRKRRRKAGWESRLRQRLQTREARGREDGCGGRRRRISESRSSSSSGGAAAERGRELVVVISLTGRAVSQAQVQSDAEEADRDDISAAGQSPRDNCW